MDLALQCVDGMYYRGSDTNYTSLAHVCGYLTVLASS